jgi:hypothetical protein
MSTTGRYVFKNQKEQMENYIQDILNVNKQAEEDRNKLPSCDKPPRHALSSLQSKSLRHDQVLNENPGPGTYEQLVA